MEKPTDLRFVRTEERIRNEFILLMNEMGFQKISVRALVERAEINRSTFYLHYPDKFALLDAIEGDLFAQMMARLPRLPIDQLVDDRASVTTAMLEIARYIDKNRNTFMLLAGEKGDPAFLHKYGETVRSALFGKETVRRLSVQQHYVHVALMGMMSSLFSEWLGRGLCETPEEYVRIVSQIVQNIPATILAPAA